MRYIHKHMCTYIHIFHTHTHTKVLVFPSTSSASTSTSMFTHSLHLLAISCLCSYRYLYLRACLLCCCFLCFQTHLELSGSGFTAKLGDSAAPTQELKGCPIPASQQPGWALESASAPSPPHAGGAGSLLDDHLDGLFEGTYRPSFHLSC